MFFSQQKIPENIDKFCRSLSLYFLLPLAHFPSLFGDCTWLGFLHYTHTPSCCWDPNPSSFRCSTGSEPEGTSGILYVYNPVRHYTCGATSSSWPYREVFIDNVPTGM